MRKGEILKLTWERVDLNTDLGFSAKITLYKRKNGKPLGVPLNKAAVEAFHTLQPDPAQRVGVVFKKRDGVTWGKMRTAFDSAVTRAGLEDVRFHDLRHTAASHMVMRGRSLKEVQEVLGHKDYRMTLRYAHLSPAHLRTTVEALDGLTTMPVGGRLTWHIRWYKVPTLPERKFQPIESAKTERWPSGRRQRFAKPSKPPADKVLKRRASRHKDRGRWLFAVSPPLPEFPPVSPFISQSFSQRFVQQLRRVFYNRHIGNWHGGWEYGVCIDKVVSLGVAKDHVDGIAGDSLRTHRLQKFMDLRRCVWRLLSRTCSSKKNDSGFNEKCYRKDHCGQFHTTPPSSVLNMVKFTHQ